MRNEKTHETLDNVIRIDSFQAKKDGFCCRLDASARNKKIFSWFFDCVPLEYDRWMDAVKVQLTTPLLRKTWQNTVDIDWITNGFGGTRAFWLCPFCGKKVRYLYFMKERFKCKECSGLNYLVQQRRNVAAQLQEMRIKDRIFWE